MTLKEYLAKNGLSAHQFSLLAGVHHKTVAKLAYRDQKLSFKAGIKIEKATGGEVSFEECVGGG